MMLARVRFLVATLWAGSLWTIGFIVAPTLFATLSDRVLAGNIAGSMFRAEAWLSIACALVLLALLQWGAGALELKRRRLLAALVLAMLVCALLSHFGISPLMAELKAQAQGSSGIMDEAMRSRFGMLHGVSTLIFAVQSLLAGVLIWKQQ
ncbi:membrane protein [Janthinobacterium lividum]|uniref:Membrane protein n=2 Tax=Janthinobacterium lividum TaxID=29581 RepID=A0A1S1U7M2_9BURK|nr:membrane protein [Janthinobacterium lividum]